MNTQQRVETRIQEDGFAQTERPLKIMLDEHHVKLRDYVPAYADGDCNS